MHKLLLLSLLLLTLSAKNFKCGPNMHVIEGIQECSCDMGYYLHQGVCQPILDLYVGDSTCLSVPSVALSGSLIRFDLNLRIPSQPTTTILRKAGIFEVNILIEGIIEVIVQINGAPVSIQSPFLFTDTEFTILRVSFDFSLEYVEFIYYFSTYYDPLQYPITGLSTVTWNNNDFELCVDYIRKLTIWENNIMPEFLVYNM